MRSYGACRAQLNKGGMVDYGGWRPDGQIYRLYRRGVLAIVVLLAIAGGLLREVKYFLISLHKEAQSPYVYL